MGKLKNALIFLPETGIMQYAKTLSVCANALQTVGYDIALTDCAGVCYRCSMENMCNKLYGQQIKEQKQAELCSQCKQNLNKLIGFYGFTALPMSNYLSAADYECVENVVSVSYENIDTLYYKDFPLGSVTAYSFMNETKLLSFDNLSAENKKRLHDYLCNTLISYIFFENYLKSVHIQFVLTFNPYSQNIAVKWLCKKNSIFYKNITNAHFCGANWSLFMMADSFIHMNRYKICQRFIREGNKVLSPYSVSKSFEDSIFRMYGSDSHIFSPGKHANLKNLSGKLGLDEHKYIFCAFTSSLDEFRGSEIMQNSIGEPFDYETVFDSQIEWLKHLRNFAKLHENKIQIVVKIHPREGLNGGSEHLLLLILQ